MMVSSTLYVFVVLYTVLAMSKADGPWDSWPTPPRWTEKPQMARYLVHYASYGVVSAFSPEYGLPFGTVQSFSDGPSNQTTGIPYYFIASLSDTYKNIKFNNSATFALSMAESEICRQKNQDPEWPPCSRVTLVGKIVPVLDKEKTFAKNALYSRHPSMVDWPHSHDWNFYKMDIDAVHLIDFFGGATHVPLKDYFAASPGPVE